MTSGSFYPCRAAPQPPPGIFKRPHPPIWAAVHSDASVEFAARNNYHVAKNLDTDAVVAGKFSLYRRIWKECGHPGTMPPSLLTGNGYRWSARAPAHGETA